jgi:deoxyuridine 5'-triphosphate nucleotidohydrolase
MICYLAGAIDFAKEETMGWWITAMEGLNDRGIHVYDPRGAFKLVHGMRDASGPVVNINTYAIGQCDAVLAEYTFDDIPHAGTMADIMEAHRIGIPVVIWRRQAQSPLYLERFPQYSSVMDAVGAVHDMMHPRRQSNFLGERPTMNVKLLTPQAKMPEMSHPGEDAGYDLFVSRKVVVPPHSFTDVHTDISVELPKGYWSRITGRSSTLRKRNLLVNEGIIDNGYRGELFAGVWNLGSAPITIYPGDRIAQLIIHKIESNGWNTKLVDTLSNSERGANGFGSTGK